MTHHAHITHADLSSYSNERLSKELHGVRASLEMLFTKNNSLDHLDLTHGGGSAEDQEEYQLLHRAELDIIAEIHKRISQATE